MHFSGGDDGEDARLGKQRVSSFLAMGAFVDKRDDGLFGPIKAVENLQGQEANAGSALHFWDRGRKTEQFGREGARPTSS